MPGSSASRLANLITDGHRDAGAGGDRQSRRAELSLAGAEGDNLGRGGGEEWCHIWTIGIRGQAREGHILCSSNDASF
ncbi:uncharacterized protein LOC121101654 isoform X2 [Ursus maritimus]|uniref:Uncharacterized protein LOC121101654 isoform X2 n=1 Tax=Ursus maritimus TaxID=29073 RepID=A0A8M1FDN8_URSMA|nr:uncharacterized protein LOC121101654 isoform X2 [Ursus maritimus]